MGFAQTVTARQNARVVPFASGFQLMKSCVVRLRVLCAHRYGRGASNNVCDAPSPFMKPRGWCCWPMAWGATAPVRWRPTWPSTGWQRAGAVAGGRARAFDGGGASCWSARKNANRVILGRHCQPAVPGHGHHAGGRRVSRPSAHPVMSATRAATARGGGCARSRATIPAAGADRPGL